MRHIWTASYPQIISSYEKTYETSDICIVWPEREIGIYVGQVGVVDLTRCPLFA